MTRMVRMAALAVLAGLVLVGCGDAESGLSGPQKEHAQRVDVLCEETQDKVGTLGDDAGADRDAVRSAAERMRALDAPSEDETVWQRFVTEADNLWLSLEDIAQAREPSVNDRPRADRALGRARDTNNRLAVLAKDYGITVCADGGLAKG